MEHLRIPKAWLDMMTRMETLTGQPCVLSGGALRDKFLGRQAKDLDLFMPYSARAVALVEGAFTGYPKTQYVPPAVADYIGMVDCRAVLGYFVPGLPPLNFVFLAENVSVEPGEVARRNDFGICQVACDSQGNVAVTQAFAKDVIEKTFTLTRTGDDERALKRFEWLSKKYPDYRLIVPDEAAPSSA